MPEQTQTPRVLWAQQREHVLLTVAVPDIEKVDVKFDEQSVSFQGQSTPSNFKNHIIYSFKIDLYETIEPEASKYANIGQKFWRLLLKKKDNKATFWPRLTKDKARLHWLQTDFDHWKEEDESDDEKGGYNENFQDMFPGGMDDMDGGPDMEDGSDEDDNSGSDNEKSPPMSSETQNGQETTAASDESQPVSNEKEAVLEEHSA